MRDVPASIEEVWKIGHAIGNRRPVARVTVQHPKMKLRKYALTSTFAYKVPKGDLDSVTDEDFIDWSKTMKVNQCYADFQFSTAEKPADYAKAYPKELPNIQSVQWSRSIDQEVAECTIELLNTGHPPDDTNPDGYRDELFSPGYFTPTRGGSSFDSRWGHQRNEWFGMLMPDNIIRTYEGYGCDMSVAAELDPYLVQTGVWIIDSVNISDTGNLSVKCRDIGRILLDQMFYQPVVPKNFYHYDWTNWGEPPKIATPATRIKVKATDSSNTPWTGSVTKAVFGHTLAHAFDNNPNTYWLSIGNVRPSRRYAYEWVQCDVGKQSVSEVRLRTKKAGYTVYVSVKIGGVWQGTQTINYHRDGIGVNGGDIKYVASATIPNEGLFSIQFPTAYKKVQAIRVTLGNLQNFHIGTYHYRAGLRDVQVYAPGRTKTGTIKKGPPGSNPGKYDDYTDLVKLICAWAGFFWPQGGRQFDSRGGYHVVSPSKRDEAVLGKGVHGRVWGDFQQTGTNGPAPLGFDNFDKKSLMDGIVYIRDILGFIFFIDELGGVNWRLPNVFDRGNWRTTLSDNPGRSHDIVHIDEKLNLLSVQAQLSSANVREAYFVGVANVLLDDGGTKLGAFAPGYNPNPTGLRRMAGWTDANFQTQAEVELMAEMLSLRQLFTYRVDRVRIPGYPRIQVDDQVRIMERTTAEGFLHYVRGVSSSLDMVSGEYTYDLDTHWLGEDPAALWIFNRTDLPQAVRKFTTTTNRNSPVAGPIRQIT